MLLHYYLHKYGWWRLICSVFPARYSNEAIFFTTFSRVGAWHKVFLTPFCCNRVTCSFIWPPKGAVVFPVKYQGRCYMNLFLYRCNNNSNISRFASKTKKSITVLIDRWNRHPVITGWGRGHLLEKVGHGLEKRWCVLDSKRFPSQFSNNTGFLFVVHLRKAVVIIRGLQCLIQWGFIFSITHFLWVWLFFNGPLMLMDYKYALRIRFGSEQHVQYAMLSILNIRLLYYVC